MISAFNIGFSPRKFDQLKFLIFLKEFHRPDMKYC